MTAQETLASAADYLETHGKCEGAYEHHGAVCAQGAIRMIAHGDPHTWGHPSAFDAAHHLYRFLARRGEIAPDMALTKWSDAHTQAEVVAALRSASLAVPR